DNFEISVSEDGNTFTKVYAGPLKDEVWVSPTPAKAYNFVFGKSVYTELSVNELRAIGVAASSIKPSTPEFSVAAGQYTGTQLVELSTATDEALIHYTTDGSDPTTASALYEGPITVDKSMTIKAITVLNNAVSEIASAAYEIIPTGLAEVNSEVAVYPTVVSRNGHLTIKAAADANVQVLNMQGQLIKTFVPDDAVYMLPMNEFTPGCYMIVITDQTNLRRVSRIVVTNN
ncbi:MAG: chitobiase/beta-hexosaminidase C-terminal domain-containing protein, partial [Bacteroidales bacterium]